MYTLLNKNNESILADEAKGLLIDINAAYSLRMGNTTAISNDMIGFIAQVEMAFAAVNRNNEINIKVNYK